MPGRDESGIDWPPGVLAMTSADQALALGETKALVDADERWVVPQSASWISRWPAQRLRVGIGGAIFFLLEVFFMRGLPLPLTFAVLGLSFAALWSASSAIERLELEAKLEALRDALSGRR